MNGRISKKLRKLMKRNWEEFYKDIQSYPFTVRLRVAWYIIRHGKKGDKK